MAEIKLPELGENIESGTITNILVKVGDTINADQNILELETDKAVLEVPSPAGGTIEEILVSEGDEIKIGQAVLKVDGAGGSSTTKKETPKAEEPKKETKKETPKETPKPAASKQPKTSTGFTPKANKDIPAQKSVNAAPSVRRFARELGVDLSLVTGTGNGGRTSQDDVKTFVKGALTSGAPATSGGAAIASKPLPDFSKFGNVKREKMSKIRQVTSEHMSFCWNTIPHVTQFDKADITELDKLRKKASTPERKITVTPFLLKVMAAALKKFPQFNASIDTQSNEIIYKEYINLGVAVDTPRGLLVPVVRDVDKKNVLELTDELNEMAARARDSKTSLDELQGGSMTLTNLGGIGGHAFTPIVNWPEVCILGTSRGGYEPVWNGSSFEPHLKLPLNLSYDHRLIDGADAARFLRWICEAIEQPFLMELNS